MRSNLLLLPLFLAAAAPLSAAEVVPVSQFDSIQLRGGGTVIVRPAALQRVTIVNGSTQFTRFHVDRNGQLKIDACNERCPQRYNLRIEIESPRVPDVAIRGGGTITAAPGFRPQNQLSAAISGGGDIDVRAVSASNVSAAVNGGGRVRVGRPSHLSAAVNGGGEIRYAGNPHVSSVVNGGGLVRRGE